MVTNPYVEHSVVLLTELSAAVVQGPSDPDHVGVGLAAGQMLHGDFLVYLEGKDAKTETL